MKAAKFYGDVKSMPFHDCKFDLVFCSNLLHLISDYLAIVMKIKRVSKRYVVIFEPNRNSPRMFVFGSIKSVERDNVWYS